MKRNLGFKRIIAALLALMVLPVLAAAEDNWPSETVTDAAGKVYKQVPTSDGGVQVWQFLGVFGSPDEALVSMGFPEGEKDQGLTEVSAKKGKVEIGEKPYVSDVKKVGEKPADSTAAGKSETKSSKSVSKRSIKLKWKKASMRKTFIIGKSKPQEPEQTAGAVDRKKKSAKWKSRSKRLSTARNVSLVSVDDFFRDYNQIYVQDNRGSGV